MDIPANLLPDSYLWSAVVIYALFLIAGTCRASNRALAQLRHAGNPAAGCIDTII